MKHTSVLIITNDETVQALLSRSFSAEGWHLVTAKNGVEGLNKIEKEPPDLVILDIILPGTEGFQICRQIRQLSQVPVIILSTSDKTADVVKCFDLGADDYVTRPLKVDELIARIKVALRHSKSDMTIPSAIPFVCDGIKIGFQKRQVFIENKEVKLTPTEYNLLLELVNNSESVMTFQELLSKVWGDEYAEDRNYLYVQISHLRNKLERDPQNPRYIACIPRVGYKFLK